MSFKLSKETEDHYVMHHKDGSFMKIAKKGLSSKLHDQIRGFSKGGKVQGYADGTPDEPVKSNTPEEAGFFSSLQQMLGNNPYTGAVERPPSEGMKNIQAQAEIPKPPEEKKTFPGENPSLGSGPVPATAPTQGPTDQAQAVLDQYNPLINKLNSGANQEAKVMGDLGQQRAQAYESPEVKAQQGVINDYQAYLGQINDHVMRTADDLKSGKIDFNRVWNNKATGDKIGTMVGMLISGLGGNIGDQNSVMRMMNKEIEADVQAQMDGKKGALEGFIRQYGNVKDGMSAAIINYKSLVAAKLDQIGAQQMGPLQKAKAQQAADAIRQGLLQPIMELGIKQTMMKQLSQGQPGGNAEMSKIFLLPKDEQKEATKEFGLSKKTHAAHEAADKIFSQIAKQQTAGNRLSNPIQSKAIIKGLSAQLVPLIMESNPSKRLTHESLTAEIEPLIPGFTASASTRSNILEQVHNLIDTHKAETPTLDLYQINGPQRNKTTSRPFGSK